MSSTEAWRIINGRMATSVVTAEFLFELYQRHNPLINPFRFREFKVEFADSYAVSSAPEAEWLRLAEQFSAALMDEDGRTWMLLEHLLTRRQDEVDNLIEGLKKTRFEKVDDEALPALLTRCVYVPLGDIYEVNLVQVEVALSAAARQELDRLDRPDLTLAQVCTPHPTAVGDFERALAEQVLRQRQSGAQVDLKPLQESWSTLTRGYGARGGADEIHHRLQELAALPTEQVEALVGATPRTDRSFAPPPGGLLERIVSFADMTATRRDSNKAKLGQVTAFRERLIAEVARRTDVEPDALSFYLLEEILALIRDRARVDSGLLALRQANGLVWHFTKTIGAPTATNATDGAVLQGQGASPGTYRGKATVVSASFDPADFESGDVLVATGTDFNLALVMRRAGAILTDEGGLLSHASVIARELQIPCVVGLNGATKTIRTGELLEVDGSTGAVLRQSASAETVDRRTAQGEGPVDLNLNDPEQSGRKASLLRAVGEGVATPRILGALSTRDCSRILAGELSLHTAAVAIHDLAKEHSAPRICIRSSSPSEDCADQSAAGIFDSSIGVSSGIDAIEASLGRLLEASQRQHVRDYLAEAGVVPIAFLITEYVDLALWGTLAVVESGRRTKVELHQGNGPTGKNFTSYWLDVCEPGADSTINGRLRALIARMVAFDEATSSGNGALIEVGVRPSGEVVALQWRPLPPADRALLEA